YGDVPIWRTHGRYRKQMKRGYSKVLYNQRNKDETGPFPEFSSISIALSKHSIAPSYRPTLREDRPFAFHCSGGNAS
ncbi:MAG: hypothetical protein WA421_14205, partial [Nitrososphaeraceae archaeon]